MHIKIEKSEEKKYTVVQKYVLSSFFGKKLSNK